jgi:Flp pilus assembly pilin Flp
MKLRDPMFWQPPKWTSVMRNFLSDQSGVAVIEYVVIASMIGGTLAFALPLMLSPLSRLFDLLSPTPNYG